MKLGALVCVLVLATAVRGETLADGVKSVRMFHDDGGRPGAESARVFAPDAGRIHILVDMASPRREPTEVGWTVFQLTPSGEGVALMERSNQASNFESLSFSCVRTPDWKPGRYRIDLTFDGKVAQSTEFSVVKDAASVKVVTVGLHQSDPAGQVGPSVSWFTHTERRLWVRVVATGCGGLPLRATLVPVGGDGNPVAIFEDGALPDSSKIVDVNFDGTADWVPGVYRAEVSAGGQVIAAVDLRID